MRYLIIGIILHLLITCNFVRGQNHACDMNRSARSHSSQCRCKQSCKRHVWVKVPRDYCDAGEDEAAPEAGPTSGSPGAFMAPPPAGRTRSPSRTLGIRGLAIKLPELTLRLPTIELPSIVRYSSNQRMELEGGVAPFVSMPTSQLALAGRRSESGSRRPEAGDPEDGEDDAEEEAYQQKCEELRQLEASLREKHDRLQRQCNELDRFLMQLKCQPRCKQYQHPPLPPPNMPEEIRPPGKPSAYLIPVPEDRGSVQRSTYITSASAIESYPATNYRTTSASSTIQRLPQLDYK